ncbi:class I SAM-dependent methyltransferase [Anaerosacchariphilus sp. NSJ-68]|uniref:Class I SAM-dependent methyltransferase n=2 Tax=Lachnospiraceae TaxID=186803 RepID=A0A923RLV4_9FIRM|nr:MULTISPECIES: class I SAM-dependent methyltransferase [Lachnospiraceae]MBC5659619.1 class I SAM-dependent methyltransferase [Anaerosacchariphilus hominis]MBC5697286.1 class I SAM-dependent methyltransferase [Roseburia difficilis]
MEEIKKEISSYWTGRSEDFARLREEELNSEMAGLWLKELEKGLPEGEGLRILDVGTGCGFFSVLLAKLGHQVTGIDLTPAMIEKAKQIARERGVEADFEVMDAEHPDFPEGTFDVIVSRNLTWTLPHPAEAYGEWLRVLKPGGVLLNFDGDYGKEEFTEEMESLSADHAHRRLSCGQLEECDKIKDQLSISAMRRPAWDVEVLKNLGCVDMNVDSEVYRRIYASEDSPFYNPTPIFRLQARKAGER